MMFVLVVIIAVACLAGAGVLVFRGSRRAQVMDRRLAKVRAWAVAASGEPQKRRKQAGGGGFLRLVLPVVLDILSRLVPVGATERAKLKDLVVKAGFRRSDALSVFMTVKLVATLAGGALLGWQLWAGQWLGEYTSTFTILLAGLAGAVVGGILPEMCLDRLGVHRQNRMAGALPDALDLMTLCLESGLTFERTLFRVAGELEPLDVGLAHEFALSEAELRLGADRRQVLHDMHVRTGVEGLRDLYAAIAQGERYGTSLAQTMRNVAHNGRQERLARIETQAAKLPVLLTLPTLLLVMPGTLLLVAGPTLVSTMEVLGTLGQ